MNVMDINGLKIYLNCDNAFLESIIQKFIVEVREITKTIENEAENQKWKLVKVNAHKMLSSVKIFEISELILLLEKIELQAEEEINIPELKHNIGVLGPLVEKTIEDMRSSFEELQ